MFPDKSNTEGALLPESQGKPIPAPHKQMASSEGTGGVGQPLATGEAGEAPPLSAAVSDSDVAELEVALINGRAVTCTHWGNIVRALIAAHRDQGHRLRQLERALVKVIAHTGLPPLPSPELMRGLLQSVERIARAAFATTAATAGAGAAGEAPVAKDGDR